MKLSALAVACLALAACSGAPDATSSPAPVASASDGGSVAATGPACLPNCAQENLAGAVIEKVSLDNASFKGADLTGARFADLKGRNVDFTGANLSGATFDYVDFAGTDCTPQGYAWICSGAAKMNSTLMTGTKFNLADLTGVHFQLVDIDQASFINSTLDKTFWHIRGKYGTERAEGVNFDGSRLRYMSGEPINFGEFSMKGTDFSYSDMYKVTFIDGQAQGAIFDSAKLDDVFMTSVDLTGASFVKTEGYVTLDRSNMTRANLTGMRATFDDYGGTTWKDVTCPDGSVQSSPCR